MQQYKEVSAICIATNNSSKVAIKDDNGQLVYAENKTVYVNGFGYTPQYLYIVDTGKIQEGDWIINGNTWQENHVIFQITDAKQVVGYRNVQEIMRYQVAKNPEKLGGLLTERIIATNNPVYTKQGIPTISQSFLQEYVKRNGKGVVKMEMRERCFGITGDFCITEPKLQDTDIVLVMEDEKPHDIAEEQRAIAATADSSVPTDQQVEDYGEKFAAEYSQEVMPTSQAKVSDKLDITIFGASVAINNAYKYGWMAAIEWYKNQIK
jgi:hypothetical protein